MPETVIQLSWESLLQTTPIYTIGYGGRTIKDFFELLSKYTIEYLIDIRSQPHSRFQPQFSKDSLERSAKEKGISYIFMGDTLGGRPNNNTCYVDGRVDYSKVREKTFYRQGIRRIHTASEKHFVIVLMCAEVKPQECHRSKLVGNTLREDYLEVAHIDEAGALKTQEEVNRLLTEDQPTLFDQQQDSPELDKRISLSRKKYISQGGRTA